MLNVENLLEERYPDFVSQHRSTAGTLSRFLSFLFYEARFQQFARDYPHLDGFDFVEEVLRYFDFTLRLRETERARIPATGRVVIVANHPIGSLDGLALLDLVRDQAAVGDLIRRGPVEPVDEPASPGGIGEERPRQRHELALT